MFRPEATPKTAEQYEAAWRAECANPYYELDAFEEARGFAVDTKRLQAAARVLACPLKVNPPNWQHGRVLYALAREALERGEGHGLFLDIGTAKGFSAVVMTWAIGDAVARRRVLTVDVIDPHARVARNSVADLSLPIPTVPELIAAWQDSSVHVATYGEGSLSLLAELIAGGERVQFAFVDGKHNATVVAEEIVRLRKLQRPGDVALFDDLQIEGVDLAVRSASGYAVTYAKAGANRRYAIAVRQ